MRPPVAIVHDFLVERGGAERVALSLLRTFPGSRLYTGLYRPDGTYSGFADHEIVELIKPKLVSRDHRRSLPLALNAFRQLNVDADVLVSSSSGLSHLANARSGRAVIYCHTPARWAHDPGQYFREAPHSQRLAGSLVRQLFRPLDRRQMVAADVVLANSLATSTAVKQLYGRDAPVAHPQSSLRADGPEEMLDVPPGFFLTPSRLLGYKRVDVLLDVASQLPEKCFVVVGEGPLRDKLERAAPENVRFLGSVSDAQLRWAYSNSRAVVLTCAEDFGLVPGEAAAFGRTSIVPDRRGFREQASEREWIRTYPHGDVSALRHALLGFANASSTPDFRSAQEGETLFRQALRSAVAGSLGG